MEKLIKRNGNARIQDVARLAGVSLGTVSRVVNGYSDVNPELRKRVLISSRRLGFVPKTQHKCIAAVIGRMSPFSPVGYVTTMIALLTKYLAAYQYKLELIDVKDIESAYEPHVDAVLGIVFHEEILSLIDIPNLPILTFNSPLVSNNIHSVAFDHYQQGILATEYLIRKGHRKIAFLENEDSNWGSKQRLEAYKDSLVANGVSFDAELIKYTMNEPLYDILANFKKRSVTAIMNFSEDSCLEVLHILTNILGLSVPEDISVITAETLPIFQYLTPPQTVIKQPFDKLARVGVDSIVELCKKSDSSQEEIIDTKLRSELIIRDSVKKIE